MSDELKELYRRALHGESPPEDTNLAVTAADSGAELPLMDEDGLRLLEIMLESEPTRTRARIRRLVDVELTDDEIDEMISNARAAFSDPAAGTAWIDATAGGMGNTTLPDNFEFPGMSDTVAAIKPASYQFETRRDWWGWFVNTGYHWVRAHVTGPKVKFRWAENYPSLFVYPQNVENKDPITIALFADFGTGLYHSRYIAHHLASYHKPDYAFHLGDVYYAGKKDEFKKRFEDVLAPLVKRTSFWALNANHEMYSKGTSYFRYITNKLKGEGVKQEQEGSYFALELGSGAGATQIIGIDTAYHDDGRHREPRLNEWLRVRLDHGRNMGWRNILLSSNQPYNLGSSSPAKLLSEDLDWIARDRLVDLWFWGNTHHCALYGRGPKTPFIGSCVGHGGYPYDRRKLEHRHKHDAAGLNRVRFLETSARFPSWTEVRQDRGNNGYVIMSLHGDGRIELAYYDWMRTLRHSSNLTFVNGDCVFSG